MFNTLSEYAKISQVQLGTTGAPTATDIESTPLDMAGYDGVLFITTLSTIPAITTGWAHVYPMVGASSASMLDASSSEAAGTTVLSSTNAGDLLLLDIKASGHRWVGCHVQKDSTNGITANTVAIQYKAKYAPNTQSGDHVIDTAVVTTPST